MTNTTTTVSSSVQLRVCPYCASVADLHRSGDPPLYGVQCRGCRAGFEPIHPAEALALIAWNRRSGGVAAAGGRATRGVSTARKRRAARANLALARRSKQMIAIRAKTSEAIARLRPYREAEQRELGVLSERTRARLAALMPRLEADPSLRSMVELLKSRLAHVEPGSVDRKA